MTRPPRSLKVGPHHYRIRVVKDGALGDAGRLGHTAKDRLVIAMDGAQAGSQMADTLLHEASHAILASVGLEDEIEERVCQALGPGLLALFVDNPKLGVYLASVKEDG